MNDDEVCSLTGLGCADAEVCELYDECFELERRSAALEVACAVPADARYEWGHESYSPAFEERISALVARRRDALLQRGMDEPPAPGLEVLRGVWGAADAELQRALVRRVQQPRHRGAHAGAAQAARAEEIGTRRGRAPGTEEEVAGARGDGGVVL